MRAILIVLTMAVYSNAALLISPFEAMEQTFECSKIEKKNTLLSKIEASEVEKKAKYSLKSKIFRIYRAKCDGVLKGYGILVSNIVRTKNAAILYMFHPDGKLESIQVVAFNEPLEFLPSKNWLSQFNDEDELFTLRVGKNVSPISGATLTARNVVNGIRVAAAVLEILKKGEKN